MEECRPEARRPTGGIDNPLCPDTKKSYVTYTLPHRSERNLRKGGMEEESGTSLRVGSQHVETSRPVFDAQKQKDKVPVEAANLISERYQWRYAGAENTLEVAATQDENGKG